MDIWEVFQQKGPNDPYVHVGSVLAPDTEMATVYAKECFYRRMEGKGLWVVRRTDVHRLSDPELLEQVTDKSYRYPEAYRGVVAKREQAHQRALAMSGKRAAPRSEAVQIEGDEY